MSGMFSGMRVVESLSLVEDGKPYQRRRSWRERLLSRPWRPLVAHVTVTPQIPYRGAVQLDSQTLVMHPETLRVLKHSLPSSASPREGK